MLRVIDETKNCINYNYCFSLIFYDTVLLLLQNRYLYNLENQPQSISPEEQQVVWLSSFSFFVFVPKKYSPQRVSTLLEYSFSLFLQAKWYKNGLVYSTGTLRYMVLKGPNSIFTKVLPVIIYEFWEFWEFCVL